MSTNWFDQGGQAYARFRPEYPPELAAYLASIAPDTEHAVDVGCGNGQLTKQLAVHFQQVTGVDPSEDQIAHAVARPNIAYQCAAAEAFQLADHSASLVTAAQAAHWFDLQRFYAQARRVATADAVLALISYGVMTLQGELNERFNRFYQAEIGPYWPPERQWVDSGYATLKFPFAELPAPRFEIRLAWNLDEFLGYVCTWSAVRSAREAGQQALLQRFAEDIAQLWGEPDTRRALAWPVNMRVGRL